MKKAFTILFMALYLVLNVGLNVMVHTCGGESEALLATTAIEDPCGCADDMSSADMCCSTEIKTIKLDDSQKIAAAQPVEQLIANDLFFVESPSVELFQDSSYCLIAFISFSPPPNKDYQVSNSSFLI